MKRNDSDKSLRDRLRRGAEVLSRFWFQDGLRCSNGWGKVCSDATQTNFCKAKLQWIGLVQKDPRGREVPPETDPYYVVNSMRSGEILSFRRVLVLDTGRKIAPDEVALAALQIMRRQEEPIGAEEEKSVSKILEVFPGASVV